MHATFLAIAVFLALAVHEIGHALGGSLRGLRLTMLIVGPVHIQRGTDGRLCWRLNRKLSYAGGMVWSAPQSTAGLRRAMLCFAAGGPVTSIVVGVLVLAIYMLWELPGATLGIHGSFRDALSLGVFTLGAASFGIGSWRCCLGIRGRSSTTADKSSASGVRAPPQTATRPAWRWVAA